MEHQDDHEDLADVSLLWETLRLCLGCPSASSLSLISAMSESKSESFALMAKARLYSVGTESWGLMKEEK